VLVDETPSQLRLRYSTSRLSLLAANAQHTLARIRDRGFGDRGVDTADGRVVVTVADSAEARAVLELLGDDVLDFEFRHGSMDDVFLAVTGRAAGDA